MKQRGREDLKKTFMGSAGWLFADLLLALAMLFLVANTIPLPKTSVVQAGPKPTATAKPTTQPHLEQTYHRFSIVVDPNAVLNNDEGENNAIIRQVLAQKFLRNRSAGLIIVYDGAPTTDDIGTALNVSASIYTVLLNLGKHNTTFARTSKYDPLYLLGGNATNVKIDIFLFAQ